MMLLLVSEITFYSFILLVSTAQNVAIVANHICWPSTLLKKGVTSVNECANLTTNSSLCNGVDFYMAPSWLSSWDCFCCTGLYTYQYYYEEGYNLYSLNATCSLTCPEDKVFTWRDCDGDGFVDPHCWDSEGQITEVRVSTDLCIMNHQVGGSWWGAACPNLPTAPLNLTLSQTIPPTNLPSSNTNYSPSNDTNTTDIREVYQCSGPTVEGSIRLDMYKCMDRTFLDPCRNKCHCASPHEIATGKFCGENCVLNNRSRHDFECISTWNYLGDGECVQVEHNKQLDITFYWGWVDDCAIEANRRPDVVAYSTIYDDTTWYQRDYQCLLYSDNTTMSGNHTCDWPKGSFFTPEGPCSWSRSQKENYCNLKGCKFKASHSTSGFSCYLRKDRYLAQQPIGQSYDKWMVGVFSTFTFGCLCIACYAVNLKRKIKGLKNDFKAHIQTTLAPGLLSDEDMEGVSEIDWKKLTVERDLGKGSFGKVFCVSFYSSPSTGDKEDTEPESYVYAVKVLHNVYNNEQREHFKNEIRLLQQALPVHINVVPIMGITKEAGTTNVGILMPYYEMGSLHDHLYGKKIKNSENFTTTAKLWIIFDIASGLNHLHANGVIHRDIAARNILLFKDMNRVNGVITDFGMAILASDTNEEGRLNTNSENKNFLGPLKWMAKECLQEFPEFSFKSDVYSFAITCWEIMTEKIPWENMSAKEAARYAFYGARPPRFVGLEVRARRDSILTESLHLCHNLKTANLMPPRRLSVSSISTTYCNQSQIDTIGGESDYESVDQQIRVSVWHLIDQCWKPEPEDRPSIGEVQESIQTIFSVIGTEGEVYNAFDQGDLDTYDLIGPGFMNRKSTASSSSEKNSPKANYESGPFLRHTII